MWTHEDPFGFVVALKDIVQSSSLSTKYSRVNAVRLGGLSFKDSDGAKGSRVASCTKSRWICNLDQDPGSLDQTTKDRWYLLRIATAVSTTLGPQPSSVRHWVIMLRGVDSMPGPSILGIPCFQRLGVAYLIVIPNQMFQRRNIGEGRLLEDETLWSFHSDEIWPGTEIRLI